MPSLAEIEFAASAAPEQTFCRQLERLLIGCRPAPAALRDWTARPLRPLLLGYTGKGNVGADIRVREIVRQLRRVLGEDAFSPWLAVMTDAVLDPVLERLDKVPLSTYFPDFVSARMASFDGVIACEGSMFTSKFSDLLSATFAGGLGYTARQGKLAIGYGAESGQMSDDLRRFVELACAGRLVIARSSQSREHMAALGIDARAGADPAWTYDPSDAAMARASSRLREAGWDGARPVAIMCPMHPFCWPVRVDFEKLRRMRESGEFADQHYDSVLFHSSTPASEAATSSYLADMARVVGHLRAKGMFVALVGMERLDGKACASLRGLLPDAPPAFVSGEHPAEDIVCTLRHARMVITSRFHASVLSLNAEVRTIGIALDERIANLFSENGMADWFFRCDAPDLADRVIDAIDRLDGTDPGPVYRRLVRRQIRLFAGMGMILRDEVRSVHPDFPLPALPETCLAFLPPLSERLSALMADTGE